MTRSDARKRLDESIDRLECADHQGTCPTPIELLRSQLRQVEQRVEAVWELAESWRCGLGIQLEAGFAAHKIAEALGDPDRLRSVAAEPGAQEADDA